MNIKNPELFLNSMWDWSPFNNCFGDTKIRIADIDGFVERNGQFLVIETKGHGVPIPFGQKLSYKTLLAGGNATLLYIWGEPNKTASQVEIHYHNGRTAIKQDVTIQQLKDLIGNWFEFADAMPRPQFA
jgi:hypothetical protein